MLVYCFCFRRYSLLLQLRSEGSIYLKLVYAFPLFQYHRRLNRINHDRDLGMIVIVAVTMTMIFMIMIVIVTCVTSGSQRCDVGSIVHAHAEQKSSGECPRHRHRAVLLLRNRTHVVALWNSAGG